MSGYIGLRFGTRGTRALLDAIWMQRSSSWADQGVGGVRHYWRMRVCMHAVHALLLAFCTAVVDQKHLAVWCAGGLGVEPAPDLVFSVVSAWADAVQQVDNSSWIHRGKGAALIIDASAHARCWASGCAVRLLMHLSPALLDLYI